MTKFQSISKKAHEIIKSVSDKQTADIFIKNHYQLIKDLTLDKNITIELAVSRIVREYFLHLI